MSGGAVAREWFEVFDDQGHPCGLAPRQEVHRQGLWHRCADVWVFRGDGSLLLQRRAADKDLFPDCWDYSVGEHLKATESYLNGARRGLREELGIVDCELEIVGDLRRVCTHVPERSIDDRELSQSFSVVHDGPVHPDQAEVAELRWMAPAAVARWMALEPAAFTPWFRQAGRELELLPLADPDLT